MILFHLNPYKQQKLVDPVTYAISSIFEKCVINQTLYIKQHLLKKIQSYTLT